MKTRKAFGLAAATVTCLLMIVAAFLMAPGALESLATQSLRNLTHAQTDWHKTSGSFFSKIPDSHKAAVLWPIHARVLESCDDGYVLAASAAGVQMFVSSEAPTAIKKHLDELPLAPCIDPARIGEPVPSPPPVTGVSVTRHEDAADPLGEAIHVSWAPTDICPAYAPAEYQVRIANARPAIQADRIHQLDTTTLIEPDIWNGSTYTVAISARCGTHGTWTPAAETVYEQSLPTPEPPAVTVDPSTDRVTIAFEPVSSSPHVSYVIEQRHEWETAWSPLMPYLRQDQFQFFPPTYEYERGDQTRIQARSDTEAEGPWSAEAEIENAP